MALDHNDFKLLSKLMEEIIKSNNLLSRILQKLEQLDNLLEKRL